MIGVGVHLYVCFYIIMYVTYTKFEWHFSVRPTLSNVRGILLGELYHCATEMLFLSSKARNPHLMHNLYYLSER